MVLVKKKIVRRNYNYISFILPCCSGANNVLKPIFYTKQTKLGTEFQFCYPEFMNNTESII